MFNNLENLRGSTHIGTGGGGYGSSGYALQNLEFNPGRITPAYRNPKISNNLVNLRGSTHLGSFGGHLQNLRGSTNIGTGGKGYGSSGYALQNLGFNPGRVTPPYRNP